MTTIIRFAFLLILPFSLLLFLSGPTLTADEKEDEFHHHIHIAVVGHQMAFDKKEFTVAAGSSVSIHFKNNDSMIHNLIVARKTGGEDVYMKIGQLVLDLGGQAHARQYVPDSDLVLAHSKLLQPGESDTVTFTAPQEIGPYPYVCTIPGHPRTMNGIMHVTTDGKPPAAASPLSGFSELHYRYYEGRWNRLPNFEELEPVARGQIPDALITLDARQQENYFGFVFEGRLPVEKPGTHLFLMRSDDGSKLFINGETVIDHDGLHGDGEIKIGERHLDSGTHDVRIEFFEHEGSFNLQLDWLGPGKDRLPPLSANGRIRDVRQFIVEVEDEPQVWRVLLPNTSPRAITVGLPEKLSYSFDPETASVQNAWQGGFINRGGMVGHGQGRGPEAIEVLGSPLQTGSFARPLRIGDPAIAPAIRFLGYRTTEKQVAFMYEVDGYKVTQTIEAAPGNRTGMTHHFEFAAELPGPVHYLVNDSDLEFSSSAGHWHDNRLTVPAGDARRFTITVIDPTP